MPQDELIIIRHKSAQFFEKFSAYEKIVFHYYLEDYSNQEIAELTHSRFDQVQNALDRLRLKLLKISKEE